MKEHVLNSFLCITMLFSFSVLDCHAKKLNIKCMTLNLRYDNKKDGLNRWNNRRKDVINFVQNENVDIICFQEVLHNQLMDLVSDLYSYSYVGVGREDGNMRGECVPVFYRKDKFTKVTDGTFWLSEHPNIVGSVGWDASLPRIATWIKLKDKKTGSVFYIMNTHFDHKGHKARKESARLIKEWFESRMPNNPFVLAGDLNVNMHSETYRILSTDTRLMRDSYNISKIKDGVGYTFHDFGKKQEADRSKIDYIFVSPSLRVRKLSIPREIPHHGVYLSDHNPIVVWLQLYK